MQTSLFPVREMHQLKAVGAGRGMSFDDENKTITISVEVVEPDAITKVQKGVLIGFSQGGSYVSEPVPDPVFSGCMRYISDPSEASLVDAPCLPSALITSIAEKSFVYVKADGSMELRKFRSKAADPAEKAKEKNEGAVTKKTYAGEELTADCFASVGKANDPSTWALPIKLSTPEKTKTALYGSLLFFDRHEIADRPKARKALFAAAKTAGIDFTQDIAKLNDVLSGYQKGLYTVQDMAGCMQAMAWIQESVTWEREMEGDSSEMPEELAALLDGMVECFINLVQEETDELLEVAHRGRGEKVMDLKALEKAQKELADAQAALEKAQTDGTTSAAELKKLAGDVEKAKNHMKAIHGAVTKAIAHHEKMHKAHDEMSEHHEAHAGMLAEAAKAAGGTDAHEHIKKAMDHHAKIHKMHKAQGERHAAHAEHLGKALEACKAAMEGKEPEEEKEKALQPADLSKALEGSPVMAEILKASKENSDQIAALAKAQTEETPAFKTLREAVEKQAKTLDEFTAALDPTLKARLTLVGRPGEGLNKADGGSPSDNLKSVGI